jgi:hypothetical protein
VPGEDHEGVKHSLVDHIAKVAVEDPWMKDHPPKVRFVGYDAQASHIHSCSITQSVALQSCRGGDGELLAQGDCTCGANNHSTAQLN